jgi:hypothetical protein
MDSNPCTCALTTVLKRIPDAVLRNLSHPANPRLFSVFDDLQVSTLASLFLRFRAVYESDAAQLSRVLHFFIGEKLASSKFSYNDTKQQMISQETPEITVADVQDLLSHFSTLGEGVMKSWAECLEGPVSLSLFRCNMPHMIAPVIKTCIFCKTSLQLAIKTQKCGGKAPGGHSWSYTYSGGAGVAVVCNSTCRQCETVYSMQTYTPGQMIMRRIGARAAFEDNAYAASGTQGTRVNTVNILQACQTIDHKTFCCQQTPKIRNGFRSQQSRWFTGRSFTSGTVGSKTTLACRSRHSQTAWRQSGARLIVQPPGLHLL